MTPFSRRGALPLVLAALAALSAFGGGAAHAATATRTIQFAPGGTSARLDGRLRGYDDVQYRLRAREGQLLHYAVRSRGDLAYASVYAPGTRPGRAEPIEETSATGSGTLRLPRSGEYTIQLFQMRASARRGTVVPYTLSVRIDPAAR